MRSIGKRNKDKIQCIIKEQLVQTDKRPGWINYVYEKVMPLIPQNIFDSWKGASSEIDRIFDDCIQKLGGKNGTYTHTKTRNYF